MVQVTCYQSPPLTEFYGINLDSTLVDSKNVESQGFGNCMVIVTCHQSHSVTEF